MSKVTPTTPYEDLPQLLTVSEAAARTRQSPWTIREAIKAGQIPARRDLGRKRIFIEREVFAPAVPGAKRNG